MQLLTIILISLGLAMDAFAVSLGIGTAGQIENRRGKLRLAFHFGIFQAGMTALGWLIGDSIIRYVEKFDHWFAFLLLAYVSYNLIRSGSNKNGQAFNQDPSTGKTLVLLSVATSIDAFAVGLTIAFLYVPVLLSVWMIGLVAFVLSAIGLMAGARLGQKFGKHTLHLGSSHLIEKLGKGRRGKPTVREQTQFKGETRRRHLGLPLIHVKTK